MIEIKRILEILPHRFPFILVDRIKELEKGKRILGIKNVTINEPFFQGHFPDYPIMPGVLIIEAMAQACGVLVFESENIDNPEKKTVLFMGIDKARFRKPVTPGDTLILEAQLLRKRGNIYLFKGVAKVSERVVAEAEFMASIVDKEGLKKREVL